MLTNTTLNAITAIPSVRFSRTVTFGCHTDVVDTGLRLRAILTSLPVSISLEYIGSSTELLSFVLHHFLLLPKFVGNFGLLLFMWHFVPLSCNLHLLRLQWCHMKHVFLTHDFAMVDRAMSLHTLFLPQLFPFTVCRLFFIIVSDLLLSSGAVMIRHHVGEFLHQYSGSPRARNGVMRHSRMNYGSPLTFMLPNVTFRPLYTRILLFSEKFCTNMSISHSLESTNAPYTLQLSSKTVLDTTSENLCANTREASVVKILFDDIQDKLRVSLDLYAANIS